ncbi:hypothetical protein chiPu_0006448 [Chiloscyllium punctatum]|uniref:Uncharacterized protein n=1 Tax=Chiloscyllium punctatum TaxID=137246 RepID=A0A401SC93_CHIPU|nr:hypothetical protein [Chiloscyllium punctatum]
MPNGLLQCCNIKLGGRVNCEEDAEMLQCNVNKLDAPALLDYLIYQPSQFKHLPLSQTDILFYPQLCEAFSRKN